jgi:hypothetical protein
VLKVKDSPWATLMPTNAQARKIRGCFESIGFRAQTAAVHLNSHQPSAWFRKD